MSIILAGFYITPGVTYSYYWTGPNNFTDTICCPLWANAQLADSGLYKEVAILGLCVSDTAYNNVQVHPYRVASVTLTADPSPVMPSVLTKFIAHIVNGGSNPSITWRKNGIDLYTGPADSATITTAEGDVISVFVCSNLECVVLPNCVSSDSIRSMEVRSYTSRPDIKVYPDPVTTALFVDAPLKTSCSLSFIDGKEVIAAYNFGAHDTRPLNTSMLSSGMYILRLYDENGVLVKVQRFIKE